MWVEETNNMKKTIVAILGLGLAASGSVLAKETYDRAVVQTSAMQIEPALQTEMDALRTAITKKDRKAVHKMISPKFEVQRDLGGMISRKMSAKKKFDTMMPGWDDLTALANMQSWGPEQPGSKMMCGPAALTGTDEAAVMRAAKQRDGSDDNTYYEWLYTDAKELAVYASADSGSKKIGALSHEAVRAVGGDDNWTNVAMPDGTLGYVKADNLYALLHPRLCFAKVKGKWMISAYVGGGD
jgi:hypothetical protein